MGQAPENTLASFARALELGAPCIELDVYCVEGQLIVFHDPTLDRTTQGSGPLQCRTFDYLRSLDAGQGERIPTLEEVFHLVDRRAGINIELAGPGTVRPVAALLNKVRRAGWGEQLLLVSSFDHGKLARLSELDGRVKLGALAQHPPDGNAAFAERLGAYSVHVSLEGISPTFIADAKDRGLRVFVYTVNDPGDIARMAGMGVDGLFTDYPERVLGRLPGEAVLIGWN